MIEIYKYDFTTGKIKQHRGRLADYKGMYEDWDANLADIYNNELDNKEYYYWPVRVFESVN